MGDILSIVSLKGGVGKTTTAVNLAAAFAILGKKTLLADCDPQGSATISTGIKKKKTEKTIYDAIFSKAPIQKVILQSIPDLLNVIPSRSDCYRTESELMLLPDKERVLQKLLSPLRKIYDYIILDTPPSMGLLTINAMAAADAVIIPLQCEFMAYESFMHTLRFARLIRKNINSGMTLAVLLTMYDMGEQLSSDIAENARLHLKHHVFETVIPRSVQLREASGSGKPLMVSKPESVGARSYLRLAKEIIKL